MVHFIDAIMMVGLNKPGVARVLELLIRGTFQGDRVNSIKFQDLLLVKILGAQWSGNMKDIHVKYRDFPIF